VAESKRVNGVKKRGLPQRSKEPNSIGSISAQRAKYTASCPSGKGGGGILLREKRETCTGVSPGPGFRGGKRSVEGDKQQLCCEKKNELRGQEKMQGGRRIDPGPMTKDQADQRGRGKRSSLRVDKKKNHNTAREAFACNYI